MLRAHVVNAVSTARETLLLIMLISSNGFPVVAAEIVCNRSALSVSNLSGKVGIHLVICHCSGVVYRAISRVPSGVINPFRYCSLTSLPKVLIIL